MEAVRFITRWNFILGDVKLWTFLDQEVHRPLQLAKIVTIGSLELPAFVLFALMMINGLGNGIIRPARDMMVRAASPKGTTGSVFGFVSAGISAGSALAPIPFGYILDIGKPEWVFYLMAILTMVALFTVAVPKKMA